MGGLSREKNSGLRRILGSRLVANLTYPHGVDRYLEQFDGRWSVNEARAELLGLRRQTADSVTAQLQPNRNWRGFKAGQYVRVTMEIDGVRRTRCFSPANSVHGKDGLIELTCKIGANSLFSRHLSERAPIGAVLQLSQAEGQFALPDPRPERILLISGGSGITPVLSMLRTLTDEGHKGPITFLHYCNRRADQLYTAELADIAARHPNVDLLRCYAEPNQGGELEGLFSQAQLDAAVPDYRDAETFLCGPAGMMRVVQDTYAADGISERLHLEHFSAAPVAVSTSDAGGAPNGEVRFARSERVAENVGGTLLDQAEAAGLKPEAGCRMGICHTCTCRKVSGRVRDTRNGRISEAGEEDIQICISVPVGSVTLDI